MSNMVKLATAIVRQNGIDTAKRSAAFDELRKLAEKADAVGACIEAVSEACERLQFEKSDVAACVKAIARSPYRSDGNDALSGLVTAQREELAAKRKASTKANAARIAAKKGPQSQATTTARVPAFIEGGEASDDSNSAPVVDSAPRSTP